MLNLESTLCSTLISEFHDTPSGGHAGVKCTLVRVAVSFFWRGMLKYLEHFVAPCLTCQQIK